MNEETGADDALEHWYHAEFDEHAALVECTRRSCGRGFRRLLDVCAQSLTGGGKLLFCGNGGSAADAQHLATELTVRYKLDRAPIAAIALSTDTSALTAIGNDLGFEHIFARQVHALGKPGDVVIGISTSGNSVNVLNALSRARELGMTAVGLGGGDGGQLSKVADLLVIVPSNRTARIQEMHIMLGQMLCEALERRLGLVPGDPL